MIDRIKRSGGSKDSIQQLAAELERATVVVSEQVPRNVVTMGSLVSLIDVDTSQRFQFELVYPEKAIEEENKISVLSPIGMGMFGFKVGDEFEWEAPQETRRFVIAKVDYQPDAANHYRI